MIGSNNLKIAADTPVAANEKEVVESLHNRKAARCEADDTTFGERYQLARDYKFFSDMDVAENLGITLEVIQRWCANLEKPANLFSLGKLLDAPVRWLEDGGRHNLPADSHIGALAGEPGLYWRERLLAKTQLLMLEVPDEADPNYVTTYIEECVTVRTELADAARRAGGRWRIEGSGLIFVPWSMKQDAS